MPLLCILISNNSFVTREYCIIRNRSWQFVSLKNNLIAKKNQFHIVHKKNLWMQPNLLNNSANVFSFDFFSFFLPPWGKHLWSRDRTGQVYSLSVNLLWSHILFPRSVPKPQLWKSLAHKYLLDFLVPACSCFIDSVSRGRYRKRRIYYFLCSLWFNPCYSFWLCALCKVGQSKEDK